jgi:hypothetical protein
MLSNCEVSHPTNRVVFKQPFWRSPVKTTFALILPVSLALLWAFPIFTSGQFSLGWFAVDFLLVMATYLGLAHPHLFSGIARRRKTLATRALA